MADSLNLDLVEVAQKSDPPVCKIMDYGKYKYEEKKKAQIAKKKQVIVEIKEIQIRPKTDTNDLEHKAKSALGFLEDGDKVKLTVFYRGRELEHIETGWQTLIQFIEKLKDQAMLETMPKLEGKRLACIFGPLPVGKKQAPGALLASLPKNPPVRRSSAPFGGGGGYHQQQQQQQYAAAAAAAASASAAAAAPATGSGPASGSTPGSAE